jgi:hypothetical protein
MIIASLRVTGNLPKEGSRFSKKELIGLSFWFRKCRIG